MVRKTALIFAGITLLSIFSESVLLAADKEAAANLVNNGDFRDASLKGWKRSGSSRIESVDGTNTLVLQGAYVSVSQDIPLKKDWAKLKFTMEMRTVDLEQGDAIWKNGRLAMTFKGADGKRVGRWPNVFNATGTTDWKDCEREYAVPEGAAVLTITPANFGKSGRAEFQSIQLVVSERHKPLTDVALPQQAKQVWDLAAAWRKQTASRDKVCINGLWRFFPVLDEAKSIPVNGTGWGWFKVPGMWPAGKDWNTGAPAQYPLLPAQFKAKVDFKKLTQAWYQRTIHIPGSWKGKKVVLYFEMVQTHVRVFVDGKDVGDLWFPGGELDITSGVESGKSHELTILHTAKPLSKEANVFMAPGRVFKNKVTLRLKGITGDVYMMAKPHNNTISDTLVMTSTRKKTISFDSGVKQLQAGTYKLRAEVFKDKTPVKTFESDGFSATDLKNGRFVFTREWADPQLWDTHTPQNLYTAAISLVDSNGNVIDQQVPFSFGFREFWIDGRDFYLNGKRIHLRALVATNLSDYADKASLEGSLNTCRKAKEQGFNFLITYNYGFPPGKVGYMKSLYDATQTTGLLIAFSLPHCKDFGWELDKPEVKGRYRKLTEWLIRRIQNNPSIISYAMNHNATGYYGDQNPLKIDGKYSLEEIPGVPNSKLRIRKQAMISQGIAESIDPTRVVYHHQSGHLGDMYTLNCYLNWAPRQERSDWLNHWAENGAKPIFFVEWGLPHIASWSSYRGPQFIWRCIAYQSLWDVEFASAVTNQKAFRIDPLKEKAIRTEEAHWAKKKPFHWSVLSYRLKHQETNYLDVKSWFAKDNWRSLRAVGASAMLPWDQSEFWRRVKDTPVQAVQNRYANLQRPGIVPDYIREGGQYIYDRGEDTYVRTSLGNVFKRWNQEVIAFVAGKAGGFTEKGHNFSKLESVHKQLVVVNDSRERVDCRIAWELKGTGIGGDASVTVGAGQKALIPLNFALHEDLKTGTYELAAVFDFGNGRTQTDSLTLNVIETPRTKQLATQNKVAVFDPCGESRKLLDSAGITYTTITASDDLAGYGTLIIGRNALAAPNSLFDLSALKKQLNILVLEQPYDVVTNRLGFRANIVGLRETFVRSTSHPALKGLSDDLLRDWRGASTLTSPFLKNLPEYETHDPKWNWCGIENTRVWRAGNTGNVASVLIEKPPVGNWQPLVDGGFNLQYAPLLEYSDAKGTIIFCQMDLSSRTDEDPASAMLCRNLISYIDKVEPSKYRKVYYAGNADGSKLLASLGIPFEAYQQQSLAVDSLLVVGPGSRLSSVVNLVEDGLNVLCLGLDQKEIARVLPGKVRLEGVTSYASCIDDFSTPAFKGLSNAELYWKTRLSYAAIKDTDKFSTSTLKSLKLGNGTVVLSQVAPWMLDYAEKPYLRSSYRRNVFLASRLLSNLGAASRSMLRSKFNTPLILTDFQLPKKWVGLECPAGDAELKGWHKAEFDDSKWEAIKVPGAFDDQRKHLANYDGYFWYRLKFQVPPGMKGRDVILKLGAIDDESWVWLNSKFLGKVTKQTNPKDHYRFFRQYELKAKDLSQSGDNTLVVRVADWFKKGGILGTPALSIESPCLKSYYVQKPISDDDPYRYYRW